MEQTNPHILLATFPTQSQINPGLQFAKRLIQMGIKVTFSTSVFAYRRISKTVCESLQGLNFVPYSDGFDDGYKFGVTDGNDVMTKMKNHGLNTLREIIRGNFEKRHPITCIVYTLPWATDLAREFHIPSALLWIQPATVLDIYYYYFNGYEEEISKNSNGLNWSIQFPGLPLLSRRDLPSLMVSSSLSDADIFVMKSCKVKLERLNDEENPRILVNTFDALEPEALKAIEKYNLIGIGPLIPSTFLGGKDPSDTSSGGDLFEKSKDYLDWLNSKNELSVVYISFGSLLNLPKRQMEEIARALLETSRPFLWVIKANENGEEVKEEERLSCIEKLEQQGMIVPWCSQLDVLTHPSLGCFVSHCGWNSTLESLSCGVPVVAFPQWTDQVTNAKLIQDVWKTGIRVTGSNNEDGTIESDEIKRCVEMVMDGKETGQELRRNAKKWKDLARESMQEGGSSYKNLKSFVEQVGKG